MLYLETRENLSFFLVHLLPAVLALCSARSETDRHRPTAHLLSDALSSRRHVREGSLRKRRTSCACFAQLARLNRTERVDASSLSSRCSPSFLTGRESCLHSLLLPLPRLACARDKILREAPHLLPLPIPIVVSGAIEIDCPHRHSLPTFLFPHAKAMPPLLYQ